jgi:penicillin-binding protein 2
LAKRDSSDENRGRARVQRLVAIVAALLFLLAGRLLYLQHIKHGYYAEYAQENQLQRERIVAPRGVIFDRNGTALVDNVPTFDVVIPWKYKKQMKDVVRGLNLYIPLDSAAIYARFDTWEKKHGGAPFPIIEDANKLEISFVRENVDLFPRLRVETGSRRRYRMGTYASHLLGYVGEVTDEFLAENQPKGYFPGSVVGKAGIEGVCEAYLKGEDGQGVVAVNASGTVLGELPHLSRAPVPGKAVYLTIDAKAQAWLEQLISAWPAGAAVAMDVKDGSILAAVSLPQFDPNAFARGIDKSAWDALYAGEHKPLFNRFLNAVYPPGSTLKVVTTYTVLLTRLVDSNRVLVHCTGLHRFGNRTFRCWKPEGHGSMDLHDGLVQSCDSYFYEVGEMLGVDNLAEACREFGLGSPTGIELPGEAKGLVPDREYYNKRYGKRGWTQGVMLNNVIGQGEYLATVLQMCRVAAAVANGGYLVQPHVIETIEGSPPATHAKTRIERATPEVVRFLRTAMIDVVESDHGTARGSRLAELRAAGKTGTAQNPHGEDHAWFIGFAPADDPEISLAILVENAGHGGAIAAPIARDFYREYFLATPPESLVTRQGSTQAQPVRSD